MYPNRFPGWSAGLGPDRGKLLVFLRENDEPASRSRPASELPGGRPPLLIAERGTGTQSPANEAARLRSARRLDWQPPFATVWEADGRDLGGSRPTPGRSTNNRVSEAIAVSQGESESNEGPPGLFQRQPWGRGDWMAILVWTLVIAAFFWDVVSLRRALFYFDITEINYPYRAFFAEELRAGRFSRWFPGLYCGMPLVQREPGGLSSSVQVSALSLDGDLEGAEPRHGALGLVDRRGGLFLAEAARRPRGRLDRGGGPRPGRIHLGPSDPHQHDQCAGERPVRHLGPGMRRGSPGDGEAPCWAAWPWPVRSSPGTSRMPCSPSSWS